MTMRNIGRLIMQWSVFLLIVLTTGVIYFRADAQMPVPPLMVGDGTLRRIHVPILMYHYVSPLPPDADATRIGLTVEPAVFQTQMRFLADEGYTPISLYGLHEALLTGQRLPAKPVILTFDDGYVDHYTTAFPILQNYGFTGTFFVITGKADVNDPAHLNWAQISEMDGAGMSMESHTKTHLDLRGRDYDFLVYELLGSMESLQGHTHDLHMFAYPAGRYDDATLNVLRSMPVWRAVTTQSGSLHTTDNWYELPRLRVTNDMGAAGLKQLMENVR